MISESFPGDREKKHHEFMLVFPVKLKITLTLNSWLKYLFSKMVFLEILTSLLMFSLLLSYKEFHSDNFNAAPHNKTAECGVFVLGLCRAMDVQTKYGALSHFLCVVTSAASYKTRSVHFRVGFRFVLLLSFFNDCFLEKSFYFKKLLKYLKFTLFSNM